MLFEQKRCTSVSNFTKITNAYDGNCYIFNHNGNVVQHRAGLKYGISFILNIMSDTYQTEHEIDTLNPVGALIKIHMPGYSIEIKNKAKLAAPNQLTRIAIKKKEATYLEHPYKDNCTQPHKLTKTQLPYSVDTCMQVCYIEEMFTSCQAVTMELFIMAPDLIGKTLNNPSSTIQEEFIDKFELDIQIILHKCIFSVLCQEVEYTSSVSTTSWPSNAELPGLIKSLVEEFKLM